MTRSLRMIRLAERLHNLGARALYEFLLERLAAPDRDLVEHLEYFAAIHPQCLVVTGGDRFPPQLCEVRR